MKVVYTFLFGLAIALGISPTHGQNLVTNPGFEDGASEGAPIDGNNWRHFAVYGASGTGTFMSAAQSPFDSGNFGAQITRVGPGGDTALDKGGGLEFAIEDNHVYRLLTDVRTPDAAGFLGTLDQQFQVTFTFSHKSTGFTPSENWETAGFSRNSASAAIDVGSVRLGLSNTGTLYADNVRLEDVTDPGKTRNVNGGFENGADRLVDWRAFAVGGAVGSVSISADASTGDQAALLERSDLSGDAGLDYDIIVGQGLGLVPGETVRLSFSAKNVSAASANTSLNARLGVFDTAFFHFGDLVNETITPGDGGYEHYSYDITLPASGPGGQLPELGSVAFRVLGDAGSYLIDDVKVTAIPEPTTLVLSTFGLIVVCVGQRRRQTP